MNPELIDAVDRLTRSAYGVVDDLAAANRRNAELMDLAEQAASMGIAINRGNMRFRERLVARLADVSAEMWACNGPGGATEEDDANYFRLSVRRATLQAVLTDFDETVSEVYEQLEVDKANNGW